MQPYVFPYLGHFQLMATSNLWVVFDSIKYKPKSWMNRNRILHPVEERGWRFATIPINRSTKNLAAKDVTCDLDSSWREEFRSRFRVYQGLAPNYASTMKLLDEVLEFDSNSLSSIAVFALRRIASELQIDAEIVIQSKSSVLTQPASHAGEWAVKISKTLGASSYINPESGRHLFRAEEFRELGIRLEFLAPVIPTYQQGGRGFIGSLSILDALMFNDRTEVAAWTKLGSIHREK